MDECSRTQSDGVLFNVFHMDGMIFSGVVGQNLTTREPIHLHMDAIYSVLVGELDGNPRKIWVYAKNRCKFILNVNVSN